MYLLLHISTAKCFSQILIYVQMEDLKLISLYSPKDSI